MRGGSLRGVRTFLPWKRGEDMSRAEQYTDYRARGSGERARHGDGGRDQRHRRRKAQCMWWRARAWVHRGRGRGRGRRDHTFTDDELGACWSAQEIVRLYQLASARMVSCWVPRRRRSAKGGGRQYRFCDARRAQIGDWGRGRGSGGTHSTNMARSSLALAG